MKYQNIWQALKENFKIPGYKQHTGYNWDYNAFKSSLSLEPNCVLISINSGTGGASDELINNSITFTINVIIKSTVKMGERQMLANESPDIFTDTKEMISNTQDEFSINNKEYYYLSFEGTEFLSLAEEQTVNISNNTFNLATLI